MLEQLRHSHIRHISDFEMVCESFDLLLDEGLLMFVPSRYAPYHHHVLCPGLEPQSYFQSLGRGHIAFDSCKAGT